MFIMRNGLSIELRAHEVHEKANSYFRTSEQYGYKFLMELKIIRDEKLFKELEFSSFDEYTTVNFNYSQRTVNERIQSAEVWGQDYERALASYGKTKTRQVAQLPEKERETIVNNGIPTDSGIKSLDKVTTREIGEYQKQLKQKDAEIESLKTRQPEIIEKEIVKEVPVKPHDYEGLKSDNQQLSEALKTARVKADAAVARNAFIENEYNRLLKERAEVDEKSKRYDELSEAIKNAQGKLNSTQKLVSDYKTILKILRQGNELLTTMGGLAYMDISEAVNNSVVISGEFDSMIRSLERLTRDLSNIRKETILEGEIINE